MVVKPAKFVNNEQRFAYLAECFGSEYPSDVTQGKKQAWEWITTGKFEGRRDFEKLLDIYADSR